MAAIPDGNEDGESTQERTGADLMPRRTIDVPSEFVAEQRQQRSVDELRARLGLSLPDAVTEQEASLDRPSQSTPQEKSAHSDGSPSPASSAGLCQHRRHTHPTPVSTCSHASQCASVQDPRGRRWRREWCGGSRIRE